MNSWSTKDEFKEFPTLFIRPFEKYYLVLKAVPKSEDVPIPPCLVRDYMN